MPGVADLVIMLVVLIGVYIGIARGIFGPLASEGAFVVALIVVTDLHMGIDRGLPIPVRLLISAVLIGVLAWLLRLALSPLVVALRRTPGLSRLDAPVGGVVHGLVALLLVYLAIGLVLDFDRNAYPLLQAGVVGVNQLQRYQQAVDQRPWLRGYVDVPALQQEQQIAASQPLTVAGIARVEGFLNFYLQAIRNPLLHSRFAPIINDVGGHLPLVGHPRPYLPGAVSQ